MVEETDRRRQETREEGAKNKANETNMSEEEKIRTVSSIDRLKGEEGRDVEEKP